MPRPRSLTNDQLATAALAVVDREGLAALTMRGVAHELRMSTMGLYRYVRDRDELAALVVELVLSRVDPTEPTSGDWPDRLREMVERIRTAVGAHPAAVPLTITHRHHSPSILRWSETVLGILAEAGVDSRRRAVALRGLLCYVIGAIQLEQLGPLAGPGTATIAGLPAEDFPRMRETARLTQQVPMDEEFHGGLELILRGLTGTPG